MKTYLKRPRQNNIHICQSSMTTALTFCGWHFVIGLVGKQFAKRNIHSKAKYLWSPSISTQTTNCLFSTFQEIMPMNYFLNSLQHVGKHKTLFGKLIYKQFRTLCYFIIAWLDLVGEWQQICCSDGLNKATQIHCKYISWWKNVFFVGHKLVDIKCVHIVNM